MNYESPNSGKIIHCIRLNAPLSFRFFFVIQFFQTFYLSTLEGWAKVPEN